MLTSKPISRELLEDYLSHSLDGDISGFLRSTAPDGKILGLRVNQLWENDQTFFQSSAGKWVELISAIMDTKPKMLTNFFSFWGAPDWEALWNRFTITALFIKVLRPQTVMQGAPNEYLDYRVLNGVGKIPSYVFAAFDLPFQDRNFDWNLIRYTDWANPSNPNHRWGVEEYAIVPDISRIEAKMWMYYLGRRYIDIGCEALNFCQVKRMNNESDDGYHWNEVFKRLRYYADSIPYNNNSYKNIRFLLISGGTQGMYIPGTNQLILDSHATPMRSTENGFYNINGGSCEILPYQCDSVYQRSKGGITPSGWWCVRNSSQVAIDNFGEAINASLIGTPSNTCYFPYNYDEMSWYAMQTKAYRDMWLKYAYFKVKCLDPRVSFALPLLRDIVVKEKWRGKYIAVNSSTAFPTVNTIGNAPNGFPNRFNLIHEAAYGQQQVIKDILSDSLNNLLDWVMHNFTNDEVINRPVIPNVKSDMIFVGNDKIYYIGIDYRIHGYIKDHGAPGVWRIVSPSHAATNNQLTNNPVPLNFQGTAKSDLVVSPDGTKLLYISHDGYIGGFNINNVWSYTYFDFMKGGMYQENIKAMSNLIYATNDRVYYIDNQFNVRRLCQS